MKHKCLGIFLAVIFIPIFLIAFGLYNLKTTFLSADFYKSEFRKVNLYSKIVENIPEFVEGFAKDEQTKKLAQIAQETIKADWLQQEVEKNLDNIFGWFYGRKDNFEIEVTLSSLKSQIEESFYAQIEESYNAAPVCTSSSMLLEDMIDLNTMDFKCRPPGKTFEGFKQEMIVERGVSPFLEEFPDEFKIDEQPEKQMHGFARTLVQPGNMFKILNWAFYISLVLSILILALLGIMAKQSLRSLFRWIGIPLAIPSFFLLVFSVIGRLAVKFTPSALSFVPPDSSIDFTAVSNIFDSLIRTMVLDISNKKLTESGIIFGIALVLIIISFFFPTPSKTEKK